MLEIAGYRAVPIDVLLQRIQRTTRPPQSHARSHMISARRSCEVAHSRIWKAMRAHIRSAMLDGLKRVAETGNPSSPLPPVMGTLRYRYGGCFLCCLLARSTNKHNGSSSTGPGYRKSDLAISLSGGGPGSSTMASSAERFQALSTICAVLSTCRTPENSPCGCQRTRRSKGLLRKAWESSIQHILPEVTRSSERPAIPARKASCIEATRWDPSFDRITGVKKRMILQCNTTSHCPVLGANHQVRSVARRGRIHTGNTNTQAGSRWSALYLDGSVRNVETEPSLTPSDASGAGYLLQVREDHHHRAQHNIAYYSTA